MNGEYLNPIEILYVDYDKCSHTYLFMKKNKISLTVGIFVILGKPVCDA